MPVGEVWAFYFGAGDERHEETRAKISAPSMNRNEQGKFHKIALVQFPFSSRKFMLRFDGEASAKVQEASFTQVCEKM